MELILLEKKMEIVAQDWKFRPGERNINMHVEVPCSGIDTNTGLMLVLHNWGGIYNEPHYLDWCKFFTDRYNVIAISVNYLQSGDEDPQYTKEKPYDLGYLQAIDCIRALYYVDAELKAENVKYNPHRCYSMGGSGGGNVSLMVNKFAPHTFACIIDICGVSGLSDALAYGFDEYGSCMNAGYSQDPYSLKYLTKAMQEIRDSGNLQHLKLQFKCNPNNKVIIAHGMDDISCPVVHKMETARNMVIAGFRPDLHFLTDWFVDGEAVTTTGHPVGNRHLVVQRFADDYLLPDRKFAIQVTSPNDFERKGQVVYPVTGGKYIIDYSQGPPSISFASE
jgi:hypothetical protein